jgi:hypothetical protein
MEWKDKELEESEAKWITGLPTGASPDGQPQAVHRLPTRKIDPLSKAFTAKSYARKGRAEACLKQAAPSRKDTSYLTYFSGCATMFGLSDLLAISS